MRGPSTAHLRWIATLCLAVAHHTQAQDAAGGAADEADVPALILPSLKPLPGYSFRGPISETAKIPGFEVSGQAARLSTSPDFLRLQPPIPLSHGAIFTTQRMTSKEWIVEIAMRVHGSPSRAGSSSKGGRGLGFWYTNNGSPAPIPAGSKDSSAAKDSLVSFFGQSTNFDGLGIVFDSAPSAPLLARSDTAGWTFGADGTGVISAVIDDGKTGSRWYDSYKVGQKREKTQEAAYLQKVVGECEAAFRNAPGLVWVRIAHFDKMIRVDLDLQPHTTLSDEQRHFSHHCLTVKDVSMPTGYYFGLSALASGNTEPDSVDIYAFDAWEVVGKPSGDKAAQQIPPPVFTANSVAGGKALAGTEELGDDPASMLQEIIASQLRMTAAIDALARQVDKLSAAGSIDNEKRSAGWDLSSSSASSQLKNIENSLAALSGGRTKADGKGLTAEEIEQQSVQYIVGQLNRLSADVKGANIRFDNFAQRVNKNIGTITNRISEVFTLTNKYIGEQDMAKIASGRGLIGSLKGFGQALIWVVVAAGAIVLAMAGRIWYRSREGGGGFRGKKLI